MCGYFFHVNKIKLILTFTVCFIAPVVAACFQNMFRMPSPHLFKPNRECTPLSHMYMCFLESLWDAFQRSSYWAMCFWDVLFLNVDGQANCSPEGAQPLNP